MDTTQNLIEYQQVLCDQHEESGCDHCDHGLVTIAVEHGGAYDMDVAGHDPLDDMPPELIRYYEDKWEDRVYG